MTEHPHYLSSDGLFYWPILDQWCITSNFHLFDLVGTLKIELQKWATYLKRIAPDKIEEVLMDDKSDEELGQKKWYLMRSPPLP